MTCLCKTCYVCEMCINNEEKIHNSLIALLKASSKMLYTNLYNFHKRNNNFNGIFYRIIEECKTLKTNISVLKNFISKDSENLFYEHSEYDNIQEFITLLKLICEFDEMLKIVNDFTVFSNFKSEIYSLRVNVDIIANLKSF